MKRKLKRSSSFTVGKESEKLDVEDSDTWNTENVELRGSLKGSMADIDHSVWLNYDNVSLSKKSK